MIQHVWTVVCRSVVIDRDSNNVSLQNVLEQISIKAEPKPGGLINIPFKVVSLWARPDFSLPVRGFQQLTLFSPSGVQSRVLQFEIDMSGEHRRFRSKASFRGLPASESGRYTFLVEARETDADNWREVATVPIEVFFNPPDTGQAEE